MGLPSIHIQFKTAANTAVQRLEKGVVALILRDSAPQGGLALHSVLEIPTALGAENKDYIAKAFEGYVNKPRQVLLYILPEDTTDFAAAFTHFATQQFDYLCAPPDATSAEAQAVVTWIKAQRDNKQIYKCVMPNTAADHEAVVNFTATGIKVGATVYTTAAYCSRIAGLLCGTPMHISAAFAPLAEVSDIARLTDVQADTAINNGELVLVHDGQKVMVGSGVTSFKTMILGKSEQLKKIKIVEIRDMIQQDIRRTAKDSYIGKFANKYDNKLLLVTAIMDYFYELERQGLLDRGSTVGIDVEAQRSYLLSKGVDVSKMSEQEIKEANTGDKVFLKAKITILDAIENISLEIAS